ncbi:MAG TPA: hypothetical protein VM734_33245, partial [Kofleriaceae bacterium]|nr:hypothetical protein [Kofleriaceae bacterium]
AKGGAGVAYVTRDDCARTAAGALAGVANGFVDHQLGDGPSSAGALVVLCLAAAVAQIAVLVMGAIVAWRARTAVERLPEPRAAPPQSELPRATVVRR